jgi:hypothetical protein
MVPLDAGHPVGFLAVITNEESTGCVLDGRGVTEVTIGQIIANYYLLVDIPGSTAVFRKASADAERCGATAVCAEQATVSEDEEVAWVAKYGRGFRYTPTLSSVERSASVLIAAQVCGAQDTVYLSRGDFGYVGFAKQKVRGFDNENRWVPALTASARKQNVGVSLEGKLSDRVGNASIPQLHYGVSGKAVVVRGGVDLDRAFKGVSSVSAEVCVETVMAAGPAEFGPVPIVVREVVGPTSTR